MRKRITNNRNMKVIYNKIIPVRGYKAINIFGVLFAREGAVLTEEDLNHERIHTAQMRETLFIGFYLWYAMEWVIRLFLNGLDGHAAYRNVSFEREAYANESHMGYLPGRGFWSFVKYLKG